MTKAKPVLQGSREYIIHAQVLDKRVSVPVKSEDKAKEIKRLTSQGYIIESIETKHKGK